ncbi:MAG TPA: histidine--tRNA ligase [Clostridia bacterium]|nr:histidine--tRNA ligase [Clostridia bacterium]
MLTSRPRGTNDILPGETEKWQYIEKVFHDVCRRYGYKEMRIPIFEHTELFERGVGDTTDIVEKEMYTFNDRGGRSVTLRPEGTASAVRAYLDGKLFAVPQPVKMYYIGPMFRYDRPQAGRYRQFHQVGVEAFGAESPAIDIEVVALFMDYFRELGLTELELMLNSVGCPKCRKVLRDRLQDYFRSHLSSLCENCRSRFDRNPLRILDCKEAKCREVSSDAPTLFDSLCDRCLNHFKIVREGLDELGVPYTLNPSLVRGLDYYTNTAFEVVVHGIGAQSSIGGGGRYDGLVELIGKRDIPGIGFAIGMERVLLAMEKQGVGFPSVHGFDVYVATIGKGTETYALKLTDSLRKAGLSAERDVMGRSLRAQMKYASKMAARYTVIVGDEELAREQVIIRCMDTGKQEDVHIEDIIKILLEKTTQPQGGSLSV